MSMVYRANVSSIVVVQLHMYSNEEDNGTCGSVTDGRIAPRHTAVFAEGFVTDTDGRLNV